MSDSHLDSGADDRSDHARHEEALEVVLEKIELALRFVDANERDEVRSRMNFKLIGKMDFVAEAAKPQCRFSRIVKNEAIDAFRKTRRRHVREEEAMGDPGVDGGQEDIDRREWLWGAIKRLSDRQRLVVEAYLEGGGRETWKVIGKALGMPRTTAEALFKAAVLRLRVALR